MIHKFSRIISKNELPERFTFPFCYTPHPLVEEAAKIVQEYLAGRKDWSEEISKGKMFGVLVVSSNDNSIGFVAAYSGNIAHSNNHPYFVPPIYDLLQPDGFFKAEESNITAINNQIDHIYQSEEYETISKSIKEIISESQQTIADFSDAIKKSKQRRDGLRKNGISKEQESELIRESQFEKAELKRIKHGFEYKISRIKEKLEPYNAQIANLKEERQQRSAALQRRLFDMFQILNAKGETKGLCEIFKQSRHELPPAGAGECAAPKMLQYAFSHNLRPIAMGEFWWGESPKIELRKHLHFYPACKSKCEPILNFMLQGLTVDSNPLNDLPSEEIKTLYEDDELWIIDKPAGMLSVPGKNGGSSVADYAKIRFSGTKYTPLVVHRLDMHTSGILIIAKNLTTYKKMQQKFEQREIKKTYVAIINGVPPISEGCIELPMRLDPENRPMQVIDHDSGKTAITNYKILCRYPDGSARIEFHPTTGRTHQLRLHSAHPEGLNCAIKGDMLYGTKAERLYLHAAEIRFKHPSTGKETTITSKIPF